MKAFRWACCAGVVLLSTAGARSSPVVLNASFESGAAPPWPGYGPIDYWAVYGGAGRNDTAGPFNNGAPIPDGGWVAFTQMQSAIVQEVSGFEPGRMYRVNYFENERGQFGTGEVARPQVTLGGQTVVAEHDIARLDSQYKRVISSSFTATGTTHSLVLRNNQGAYDNTALWDSVLVERWAPAPTNHGFEDYVIGPNSFQYTPNGAAGVAWSFGGGAGLCRALYDNVGFGGPSPEGNQLAFMQGWAELSQVVGDFEDGVTYNLTWLERNRTNIGQPGNYLEVFLDGVSIYGSHVVDTATWVRRTTDPFTVHGTSHTLTFRTYGNGGYDVATLLDDAYFNFVVPEPATVLLLTLGGLAVLRRRTL